MTTPTAIIATISAQLETADSVEALRWLEVLRELADAAEATVRARNVDQLEQRSRLLLARAQAYGAARETAAADADEISDHYHSDLSAELDQRDHEALMFLAHAAEHMDDHRVSGDSLQLWSSMRSEKEMGARVHRGCTHWRRFPGYLCWSYLALSTAARDALRAESSDPV